MQKTLWLSLLLLAACSAPQGIRTTGDLRLQSVQPDVVAGCPVRAGDWMTLKGNRFGSQADWDQGRSYALFPPEPGLRAEAPEITQAANPATLMFRVPKGAVSGTLRLHVEGVGDAEIPVTVQGTAPQMAVPECEIPVPPPSR
uniref:Cell surface protein n=1 Tax=Thermus islandicus TaxID=540988 RepID=A0A7C2C0E2_9DEIN